MAISYSFTDNVSYGTEDINKITQDLIGAGVSPFATKDVYSASDLNSLTEAVISSGTSLDGCKCTKNLNIVTVAEGTVFFENGVRLWVDSEGYNITVPSNTSGYVYAYFSPILQNGGIEFAEVLPEDVCCVTLAEVSEDGTLHDKRQFARGKVATLGSNLMLKTEFQKIDAVITEVITSVNPKEYVIITKTIEGIDLSKFNYAIIKTDNKIGLFDLSANKFILSCDTYSCECLYDTNYILYYSNYPTLKVYKSENSLLLKQTGAYNWDYYSEIKIEVTLI